MKSCSQRKVLNLLESENHSESVQHAGRRSAHAGIRGTSCGYIHHTVERNWYGERVVLQSDSGGRFCGYEEVAAVEIIIILITAQHLLGLFFALEFV